MLFQVHLKEKGVTQNVFEGTWKCHHFDKTSRWLQFALSFLPTSAPLSLLLLWPVISSGLCCFKWPCLPLASVAPYYPYVHCLCSRGSSTAWWYLEELFSLLNKLSKTLHSPQMEFPRPQRLKTQLWSVILSPFTHSEVSHQRRSRENRFKNHSWGTEDQQPPPSILKLQDKVQVLGLDSCHWY